MGMPKPVWDPTGGPAVEPPSAAGGEADGPRLTPGAVNKVVWMCWTGHNPLPPHLRLCLETVRRNSGLPVVLITPKNVAQYVPDPHPAYPYLHLAHRADYLRCCLLHTYGGLYLDVDTICLRSLAPLFDLLDRYDAVGYDGSQWGELVGISDMGPFRPNSELTTLWFNALHGKLHQRLGDMSSEKNEYPFYWQEILRDVFVPVSLMHRERISTALQAHNPEQEQLWSVEPMEGVLGDEMQRSHLFILNNAKYGEELGCLTEEQILGGPAVLSQILRHALGR